ncbi:hypothetical protein RN001_012963 [Aquatica leii]|uniref:Chitin-binding type-2 domain-containing protein n=1 Tax=Aquatica leii TaxID=1421715 RepID=A0AAN7QCS2_9COLE|nr:hypothetical protein RN001_012963 [Aquatica leii]
MSFNIFMLLLPFSLVSCYYQSELWTDFRFVEQHQFEKLNTSNVSGYCKKPGLQCADCETSILCRLINGNYVGKVYDTCVLPQTCDEGACVDNANVNCTKQQYQCQTVEGMYPDPKTCQKFHYCVPDKDGSLAHTESKCDEGYYYNALTTYCDKKLLNGTSCPPSSIPKCIYPAQSGALKENPSIYYTCFPLPDQKKTLYPFLDACEHGEKYDNVTYSCK